MAMSTHDAMVALYRRYIRAEQHIEQHAGNGDAIVVVGLRRNTQAAPIAAWECRLRRQSSRPARASGSKRRSSSGN
jgi:hypothetical protein